MKPYRILIYVTLGMGVLFVGALMYCNHLLTTAMRP